VVVDLVAAVTVLAVATANESFRNEIGDAFLPSWVS
jgi:hypothetical protein